MTPAIVSTGKLSVPLPPLAFRHTYGAAGWVVRLAPGALAGAAIAMLTGRRPPGPRRVAVGVTAGLLGGTLLARVADEAQWRRSAVSLEVDEPDVALDLMQAVRAEGMQAEMIRAEEAAGPARGSFALRYRAKDDRRIRAVLAEQQG